MGQELNLSGPSGIVSVQHVTSMEFKCLHEKTATQGRFWQLPFGLRHLAPLHTPLHAPFSKLIHKWFKNSLGCLLLGSVRMGSFYKEVLNYNLAEIKFWLSLIKRAILKPQELKPDMASWKSCLFKKITTPSGSTLITEASLHFFSFIYTLRAKPVQIGHCAMGKHRKLYKSAMLFQL